MTRLTAIVCALGFVFLAGCSSSAVPTVTAQPEDHQARFDKSVQLLLETNQSLPDYNLLKDRLEKFSKEQRPTLKTKQDVDNALKAATKIVANFYEELGTKLGDHPHKK